MTLQCLYRTTHTTTVASRAIEIQQLINMNYNLFATLNLFYILRNQKVHTSQKYHCLRVHILFNDQIYSDLQVLLNYGSESSLFEIKYTGLVLQSTQKPIFLYSENSVNKNSSAYVKLHVYLDKLRSIIRFCQLQYTLGKCDNNLYPAMIFNVHSFKIFIFMFRTVEIIHENNSPF